MNALSHDRIRWLDQRIFVLDLMIRELTQRQARYQSRPQYAHQHSRVMESMIAEQLQLSIEKNAMSDYFIAEAERFEAQNNATIVAVAAEEAKRKA